MGDCANTQQYYLDTEIESAVKLLRMFEDSDDLIISYNENLQIIFATSFAVELFQLRRINSLNSGITYVHSDWNCRAEWENIVNSVFISGSSLKFRLQMPDGDWYTWVFTAKQDKLKNDLIVRCLGINSTEEIEKENRLKSELKQEQEFNTMISRFVSSASYELRTELTHINLNADLLDRFYRQWSQEKVTEQINKIRKSVDNLNFLISKILVLNGTGLGSITFNPEVIDVAQVVKECIDASKLFNSCHIGITYSFNSIRKHFVFDRLQFGFMLVNLIMIINNLSDIQGKCHISVELCKNLLQFTLRGEEMKFNHEDTEYLASFFTHHVEGNKQQPVWTNGAVIKYFLDTCKGVIEIKEESLTSLSIMFTVPVGEPY